MTLKVGALGIAMIWLLGAAAAQAHHSFAATFDENKPVNVTATVTQLRWENPHTLIYADVKDERGVVQKWTFETYPPGVLYRKGLRQNRLKPGAVVTMKGFGAKAAPYFAEVSIIEFPDGESFCIPASGSTPLCDANER
jgi:hypothetical protein